MSEEMLNKEEAINEEDTVKENPEVVEEERIDPITEEEKEDKEENPAITEGRERAVKYFKEMVDDGLTFESMELIPNFLMSLMKIHLGKTKIQTEMNKLTDKMYTTPIKDLEIYESVEESNNQD